MIESVDNMRFDSSLLTEGGLVFDLGALNGIFSSNLAGRKQYVVAFEPDDYGATTIPISDMITVVKKAIGFPSGKRTFYSYAPASGANGLYLNPSMVEHYPPSLIDVDVITLQEAVDTYGLPDLLKMNVEGAEVEILMNSSDDLLQSIHQMAISFHAFCRFVTKDQEDLCKRRLESLGFSLTFGNDPGLPEATLAIKGE